jgi:hypothetical protein
MLCALTLSSFQVQAADALATLAFINAKGKIEKVEIELKAGKFDSTKQTGLPVTKWALLPGDALKTNTPPSDRELVLYATGDAGPALLCIVSVHYYPAGNNQYQPQYRIQDRMTVTRVNGHWNTIPLGTGNPELTELPESPLPNPDGYRDRLAFGLPNASLAIAGWEIR